MRRLLGVLQSGRPAGTCKTPKPNASLIDHMPVNFQFSSKHSSPKDSSCDHSQSSFPHRFQRHRRAETAFVPLSLSPSRSILSLSRSLFLFRAPTNASVCPSFSCLLRTCGPSESRDLFVFLLPLCGSLLLFTCHCHDVLAKFEKVHDVVFI